VGREQREKTMAYEPREISGAAISLFELSTAHSSLSINQKRQTTLAIACLNLNLSLPEKGGGK